MILTEDIFDVISNILLYNPDRIILIGRLVLIDVKMIMITQEVRICGFYHCYESVIDYYKLHSDISCYRETDFMINLSNQLSYEIYHIGEDVKDFVILQQSWEDITDYIIYPLENP